MKEVVQAQSSTRLPGKRKKIGGGRATLYDRRMVCGLLLKKNFE